MIFNVPAKRIIRIFILGSFIICVLNIVTQCTDPKERINVKIVTVRDGVEQESFSYLDDCLIEFELLDSGEGGPFFAMQQEEKMSWKKGEPNTKLVCIIEDSVSNRVQVDGFTKAKEFPDRASFVKFMTAKGYKVVKNDTGDFGEKIQFEK